MYLAGPLLNWKVHVHAQKYLLWGRMRFIDPPASNIASEGRGVTVYIPHSLAGNAQRQSLLVQSGTTIASMS